MPKSMTFNAYSDPGHAWVKVKRDLLLDLGIEDRISRYSYQKGEYCYLEEDADLDLFVKTLKSKGIEYKFSEHSTNRRSRIRSYYPYQSYNKKDLT
tara:strand:+ start:41106 stop:41393 length:288 start_codon:yes stop_codon:yes gene_type:complete